MNKNFCVCPLWEAAPTLIQVAQGKAHADLVIRHATLVNVNTAECMHDVDIAIALGRIAYVGKNAEHTIGEHTEVLDACGSYIAPGFLDGHIHVESSMVSVAEYARATVAHGTVGIYLDPHEIGNVLGMPGIELMAQDAKRSPLKAMITTPSCVPAVPGFEDTGASIGINDVAQSMTWPSVVGLGEMMNFPGVLANQELPLGEMKETFLADKVVTGHFPVPDADKALNAYAASGVNCCHESTRAQDALEKMRLGMYAMFREGSAWRDLHALAPAITGGSIDTRYAILVSDDNHPDTLISQGHCDHLIRRAIEEGIDPITAIQMVTINPATCFKMQEDLGSISPGKCADMVLFDSLETIDVQKVWIDGVLVAQEGHVLFDVDKPCYPAWAIHSMHVGHTITPETFSIPARSLGDTARVRVMQVSGGCVENTEVIRDLPIIEGCLGSDVSQDVLKTFVFERHHQTKTYGYGFTCGFGITRGAIASTVAHDAHNLLVLGTNDYDMSIAANALIECEGGQVVVVDGEVIALNPLPLAGLMSCDAVEVVADRVRNMEVAWERVGCTLPSPFMTMALISLACIPDVRLTNRGLVDCRSFNFVDLEILSDE